VEIITRLWTEDRVTFAGEFYRLESATCEPKPVQRPHPPIWWAGKVRSIPRAARYAEYFVTFRPRFEEIRDHFVPLLAQENEKRRKRSTATSLPEERSPATRSTPGSPATTSPMRPTCPERSPSRARPSSARRRSVSTVLPACHGSCSTSKITGSTRSRQPLSRWRSSEKRSCPCSPSAVELRAMADRYAWAVLPLGSQRQTPTP